jgi:hypothetical protein
MRPFGNDTAGSLTMLNAETTVAARLGRRR